MDRRHFIIGSAAATTALASGTAGAQDAYPSRPGRFPATDARPSKETVR